MCPQRSMTSTGRSHLYLLVLNTRILSIQLYQYDAKALGIGANAAWRNVAVEANELCIHRSCRCFNKLLNTVRHILWQMAVVNPTVLMQVRCEKQGVIHCVAGSENGSSTSFAAGRNVCGFMVRCMLYQVCSPVTLFVTDTTVCDPS
jgi:hypothetical protein